MIFKVILFVYILINSFQSNEIEDVWITQDDETGKKNLKSFYTKIMVNCTERLLICF